MSAIRPYSSARMARCCRRISWVFISLAIAITCCLVCAQEGSSGGGAGGAEDVGDPSSTAAKSDASSAEAESPPKAKRQQTPPASDSADDWGSFYDPNNVFCGKFDCYKILKFDHETWGSNPPSLKDITKSYRNLSRKWHPDKNKAEGAKKKFVAIAKAYEILTNKDKRAEYDYLRDHHDEYFKKYGSSVLWSYAPKSDASMIILLFLIAGSGFTYYAQKNKWQTIANHLVKAAVEDLSPREGGSTESFEIREKALAILAKKREESEGKQTNGTSTNDKKKKGPRMTGREKREKEWEELRPICIALVNEIDDFGAGFRKPSLLQDLLVLKMVKLPYYVSISAFWWSKYALRRVRKVELNKEEREVLTKNAVGEVSWIAVSEEERATMLTLELWITDNLVEWRAEQEMKMAGLSANRRKQIKKMRKRGSRESLDEDHHMD